MVNKKIELMAPDRIGGLHTWLTGVWIDPHAAGTSRHRGASGGQTDATCFAAQMKWEWWLIFDRIWQAICSEGYSRRLFNVDSEPPDLNKIKYIQCFVYTLNIYPATRRRWERMCLSMQKVNKAYTRVKKLKLTAQFDGSRTDYQKET